MNAASIAIGIFDDHPIITDGMKGILGESDEFELTLVVNSKKDLFAELTEKIPRVLILDVVAPDVSGLDLFTEVREKYPDISLVAYTTLNSTILVENLLISGAHAYINKRQRPEEIREALREVCNGRKYVPEEFRFLLETINPLENPVNLTQREREILALVLDGKLSKEIADLLNISQNTVENHRANIFRKFEVSNLAELFKQAARLGYLGD